MKGLQEHIPCVVTSELVDLVAETNSQFKDSKGEVRVYEVLHYLGFQLDHDMKNKDIEEWTNVYVRDPAKPYMLYKPKKLYNGKLRWADHVVKDKDGKVVQVIEKAHKLKDLYESTEVLQPHNINTLLDACEFVNMEEVGTLKNYDKGFKDDEKPTTGGSGRNIVRK